MKITTYTEPFHYLKISNVMSREEAVQVFKELDSIKDSMYGGSDPRAGSAKNEVGVLKSNRNMFIHDMYDNPVESHIFNISVRTMEPLASPTFRELCEDNGQNTPFLGSNSVGSWFFDNLLLTRIDTLVSYYEDKDYYNPHRDQTTITSLMWFFREPKKFEGGLVSFPDYGGLTLPLEQNVMVVFPSNIRHEVSPIKMLEEDRGKGLGRYVIANFGHTHQE